MVRVDVDLELPSLAAQWMMGNLSTLLADLGERWPHCAPQLTDEISGALFASQAMYNLKTAAVAEERRLQAYQAMSQLFEQVDFVIASVNPDVAFAADAWTSNTTDAFMQRGRGSRTGQLAARGVLGTMRFVAAAFPNLPSTILDVVANKLPDVVSMGALTMVSNIYGNPAVSIPAGTVDGLPVGMQVLATHHADALLFDVALAAERTMPWPLVAPAALQQRRTEEVVVGEAPGRA
jgi:aspartyl-tRNA(Asn)/glutamyl-tRNA(Gln) amidotransferase subunit A